MKSLRKSAFQWKNKNQPKFWKEKQQFIFTAYLMNYIFQTSVPLNTW